MKIQGVDSGLKDIEEINRALVSLSDELKRLLNNGLLSADNNDSVIYEVSDSGTAGVEFSFSHGLGRTPQYYRVLTIDKAGVVYTSTAHDGTTAYFKCNAGNAAITIELW